MIKEKIIKRLRRKKRVKAKVFGTKVRPRLSVFRSLKHLYAQVIDDEKDITLVSASDLEIDKKKEKESKTQIAFKVGEELAKKSLKKKIQKVTLDRNGYKYHGRVKALADGARKGGLEI